MKTEDFEKIDILELLPQKPPFVMIDNLIWCDEVFTRTKLCISPDNIFIDEGVFSAYGLIENIAQTCAARVGYINHILYKSTVKIGFIGAIRNLRIYRRPIPGENLITEIEVMEDIMQMTLVNAKITSGDELLVSTEMKIALSNIDSKQG